MLTRTLSASEGVLVTYTRLVAGSPQSATITARVGRSRSLGQTESGINVQSNERDFLVEVAALVLGGSPTTPHRGDRITLGGTVWEVAAPQSEEPPWGYSDVTRTLYRIHTKRAS